MSNNLQDKYYPVALTVAGSDSGGGAGIQADLRTFSAFGVYGCSVVTAVTSQNTKKVFGVDPVSEDMIISQLDSVLESFCVKVVKTGMLSTKYCINQLADKLEGGITLVVDPVLISTSGNELLEIDAVDTLKSRLLPKADWLTPNISEAELLSGVVIETIDDMVKAAEICSDKWNCSCIVKGGHIAVEEEFALDIVVHEGEKYFLSSPRLARVEAGHGTGCTFSSAIAASLAVNMHWKKALCSAKAFVFGSLAESVEVGNNSLAMYPPMDSYTGEVKLKKI